MSSASTADVTLAQVVERLCQQKSYLVALERVTRALRSAADERRAYLLNLRGIVHAQRGQDEEAQADLAAASQQAPRWHIPPYNRALCHKRARRWVEMQTELRHVEDGVRGWCRAASWNQGIAATALGQWTEARAAWEACGINLPPGDGAPALDMGMDQLTLPTAGVYAGERVWAQRIDPARAQILSIVRFGGPGQVGDTVLCDEGRFSSFCDGVWVREDEARGGPSPLAYLATLAPGGAVLHVIQGGPATEAQAIRLTERFREADLRLEVWSLTMRLPDAAPAEGGPAPVHAGLALAGAGAEEEAERAAAVLAEAGRALGLALYAPTLLAAAGDELGAARHRKALRR